MNQAALTAIVLALWTGACAGSAASSRAEAPTRLPCPSSQYWNGSTCRPRGSGSELLNQGAEALSSFRVEDALALLDRARDQGPHVHALHARIYEQLGIAYAYLGQEQRSIEAFAMLLSLEPRHLLSYTLSPKATFLFERARKQALERQPPTVHLSWPHGLDVTQPVPVDVEVVANPGALLHRAELYVRRKGEARFSAIDVPLPAEGAYRRVQVPALRTARPEVLELYLTAFDQQGNEVLLWADPARPREIALDYDPPVAWYRTWWVWAAIGGAVAAGTGAVVYAVSREPPALVGGRLDTSW